MGKMSDLEIYLNYKLSESKKVQSITEKKATLLRYVQKAKERKETITVTVHNHHPSRKETPLCVDWSDQFVSKHHVSSP